jgi:hypothetical protein
MRTAAVARRRVIQRAGFRLRERDQLAERLCRHGRMHDQHVRHGGKNGDRRVVLRRVVRQLRVQRRRDRQIADRRERQRVTVGRGLRALLQADVAAGTGAVLDDERLPEHAGEAITGEARERIRRPPGRERNENAHRMRGVRFLRARHGGWHGERNRREQAQGHRASHG